MRVMLIFGDFQSLIYQCVPMRGQQQTDKQKCGVVLPDSQPDVA